MCLHPLSYLHVFGAVISTDTTWGAMMCNATKEKIKDCLCFVVVIDMERSDETGVSINECMDHQLISD